MSYHIGQQFRSERSPYRFYEIIAVGQVRVTVTEKFFYPFARDRTVPWRREAFKMTKRPGGKLSYGYEYYETWIKEDEPEMGGYETLLIAGGVTAIASAFVLASYAIVGL